MFIEPDGVVSLYTVNNAHTGLSPSFNSQVRFQQSSNLILRGGNAFGEPPLPLFQTPGVTDRSLYDHLKVNLFAPNFSKDKADLYQVELEQWFIDTRRHRLALQGGFFREDIDRMSRSFLGASDGAPPILRVDINEFLFDGTPNPYFMRPYIIASEPQIIRRPEINDNYRGTLAYGFSINLFDGKLVAKVNKYETVQKNSRSGTSGALTQRMFRPFIDPNTGLAIPGAGSDWWTTAYGSGAAQMARGFYEINILAPFKLATANAGKPRPQTREWRFSATTNFRLAGMTEQRHLRNMSIGGALRWEDKAVAGYFGGEPSSDGAVREYDANRPIFDKASPNISPRGAQRVVSTSLG